LQAGRIAPDHGYMRFWHGYQAYFRVLLSVVPFDVMMRITALLFYAALIFFAVEIGRLFGGWAWAIAIPPFFALRISSPPVQQHYRLWAFSLSLGLYAAGRTRTDVLYSLLQRGVRP
jgi:hypothetical protein